MIRVLPAFKIGFADGGQAITCCASGCIQKAINLLRKLVTGYEGRRWYDGYITGFMVIWSTFHRWLLFTPYGCSSNSIQPILSRLTAVLSASDACLGRTGTECRRAGYYGKCYFIGRTPCSRVHDAVWTVTTVTFLSASIYIHTSRTEKKVIL